MKNHKRGACLTFFILMTVGFVTASEKVPETKNASKQATTTGFMQEITETRIHVGPERSGKEIYEFRCKGCHARNTQGAPMPDDKFAWSTRLRKGFEVLMQHSMDGYNNYLMPPKGGCRDCKEQEVRNAVIFMLQSSGIKLPPEVKKRQLIKSVKRKISQ